jgi:hypothetical protein
MTDTHRGQSQPHPTCSGGQVSQCLGLAQLVPVVLVGVIPTASFILQGTRFAQECLEPRMSQSITNKTSGSASL